MKRMWLVLALILVPQSNAQTAYVPVGATRTIQSAAAQCPDMLYTPAGCLPLQPISSQVIQVIPDPDVAAAALNYCLAIPPAPGQNPPNAMSCALFVQNIVASSVDVRLQSFLDMLRAANPQLYDNAMEQVNLYQRRVTPTILPPISVIPTTPVVVGQLVGAVTTDGAAVDLTAEGVLDWIKWEGGAQGNLNRKAGVNPPLISDYVASTQTMDCSDAARFSWTDGTPGVSGSMSATGVRQRTGGTFTITVPAPTTTWTLYVHVKTSGGSPSFTAHLSDGSAPDYVDSSTGNGFRNYAITYNAASAGQTLTITWGGADYTELYAVALK